MFQTVVNEYEVFYGADGFYWNNGEEYGGGTSAAVNKKGQYKPDFFSTNPKDYLTKI